MERLRKRFAPLLLLLAVLAVSGCKPRAPAGPTVRIVVDDEVARTATLGDVPLVLADLLPAASKDPATWLHLEADASGGRFLAIRRPTESYGKAEVRLYLQHGRPAIGLFRPAREGLSPAMKKMAGAPALSLVDITEVRVLTRERALPPEAPLAGLTLQVQGSGQIEIPESELSELRLTEGPRRQAFGWKLAEVLALEIPPEEIEAVLVSGSSGEPIRITSLELAAPDRLTLLKRNKKGEFKLSVWSFPAPAGEGEIRPLVEISNVSRIKVERKAAP